MNLDPMIRDNLYATAAIALALLLLPVGAYFGKRWLPAEWREAAFGVAVGGCLAGAVILGLYIFGPVPPQQ